jgi:ATP-dependent helicase IRC3
VKLCSDETTESLERRAAELIAADTVDDVPEPKSVTYIDHEDPFSLVDGSSGAPHIITLSKNAWVGCGENVYVLECLGKGYMRIELKEQDGISIVHGFISSLSIILGENTYFEGRFVPAMLDKMTASSFNLSPFMRSRQVLTADNLSDAVRGCDTYAIKKVIRGSIAQG